MKAKRAKRKVVHVHVPDDQSPFVIVPGKHGGVFLSVLWNYGEMFDVPIHELRRLVAGSKGEVIVARRLAGNELRFFEQYRKDIDQEVCARLVYRSEMKWRSPRKR